MKFQDVEIDKLDLAKVDDIFHLIVECLCGERHYGMLPEQDRTLLQDLVSNARTNGLNYEQFNELLLLLNQDRVSRGFFKFFFEKENILLEDLRNGVVKFRGFAMLCFGNFKFAYKQLIKEDEDMLRNVRIQVYCKEPSNFSKRPSKMLEIDKIERNKTWYVGEVSGAKINREAPVLGKEIELVKNGKSQFKLDELEQYMETVIQKSKDIEETQKKALRNTDIYLTWDYMDIYVATSMRNRWEFEETYDFIEKVFNDSHLGGLNIRYFDPTQSKCGNPRDKGLVEGLMLKRTLCTIYLAQESDTMGKDSELAATLAQSKPVIAYVPKYDMKEYSEKIKEYPLDFFKKRLLVLNAEEVFRDSKCTEELSKYAVNYEEIIDDFLNELYTYRQKQPFSLWDEKEIKFKQENKKFPEICNILAIAECFYFDRRADLLRGRHPLSMQVDLQFGIANGVLVVRSSSECSKLLYRIINNKMEFTIKHMQEGFNILEESITKSPFRVVTDHEKLTNSFWNLFA